MPWSAPSKVRSFIVSAGRACRVELEVWVRSGLGSWLTVRSHLTQAKPWCMDASMDASSRSRAVCAVCAGIYV